MRKIIYNKRGIGYFICDDAHQTAIKMKRDAFIRHDLPHIFRTLHLLKIDFKTLEQFYQEYCKAEIKEKRK
jgi:GntR family transcriptional regulator